MPVPKRKTSKARRNKRSANKYIRAQAVGACLTCQQPLASHQVCKMCGHYKGVKVLRTKMERMQQRAQASQDSQVQDAQAKPAQK